MPIYDFSCTKCASEFEVIVLGADTPICPTCGSAEMQKLVSIPAPQGKTKDIIAGARRQAAREGHFSNYAQPERPKRK